MSAARKTPERDKKSESASNNDRLPGSTIAVLAVLVVTSFVMMLNETSLSVALPEIMAQFDISASTAQWSLTGVMLTMAIVMPTTGWVMDRFTTRQVYFFALITFLIGSVIAAWSPTFSMLLLGRVLQAAGTAVLIPLQSIVVMLIVPANRRGTVMGLISIVQATAPALGPTFSGLVMTVSTWHTTFWIMAVLVAITGLFAVKFLKNVGTTKDSPLDVFSVFLAALAFGGLVYGLSSISAIVTGGPAATTALVITVVGLVSLVLFVWRQVKLAKEDRALLNLAPLRVKNFVVALLSILFIQATMLGVSNTLPLYLQGALLASVLVAGLVNLPGGLLQAIVSPFAGALYDRVGPRPLVIPGMIIAAASLYGLATVDSNTSVWFIVAMFVVFSGGLSLVLTPMMTTALSSLSREVYSHGSAILNTLMQLAGAAGTAAMIAIFDIFSAAGGGSREAMGEGAANAFLVGAVLLTLGVIVALSIQRPDLSGTTKTVEPTAQDLAKDPAQD